MSFIFKNSHTLKNKRYLNLPPFLSSPLLQKIEKKITKYNQIRDFVGIETFNFVDLRILP